MVGPNGEQVGIVRVEDALRLAAEADLDLVEVAPMAKPPVCKLMDFGKFKYEAAMKAREARKNQVNTVIKEIKLRPKIDPHDYGTKKGHVERFLKAGDKVKVTIMFRGREQSRPELGYRLLQRLAEDVAELGFVESSAQAGRPQHDHGARARPRRRPRPRPSSAAAAARRATPRGATGRPTRRADAACRRRPTHLTEADGQPPAADRLAGRGSNTVAACGRPSTPSPTMANAPTRRTAAMPKMKTHSGAKKRFRITGKGKVMREQAGGATCSSTSPRRRPVRIANDVVLAQAGRQEDQEAARQVTETNHRHTGLASLGCQH